MTIRTFISYRHDDSAGHAGRIHDRLAQEFGQENLFMDVDSIPLGVDFRNFLASEVEKCEVMVAVIGSKWIDIEDDNNHRRIDDPNDFIHIELHAALFRDIPIIPILLDTTQMPKRRQLPEPLRAFADRQAIHIRHT